MINYLNFNVEALSNEKFRKTINQLLRKIKWNELDDFISSTLRMTACELRYDILSRKYDSFEKK
jgi:hypothetical protein